MAQIRSVGAGIRSKGNVDGLVYVHVKGKTYARALPIMPADMFKTPEALKRQALFTLVQWHIRAHAETIKHTFSRGECWSARNRYHKVNARALAEALDSLAETYANGGKVSVSNIESAIADYASSHQDEIIIGLLEGHQPVYLKGAWPEQITISSLSGDGTIVVIEDRGVTTTITPTGSSSSANAGNGGSTGGSSTGGNTGGSNNGGGTSATQYTISGLVSPSGYGVVNVSPVQPVSSGTEVTLNAVANSGKRFVRWSDGNTQNPRTVTATATKSYTAVFENTASSGGSTEGEGPDAEGKVLVTVTGNITNGNVEYIGSGRYTPGEQVQIQAKILPTAEGLEFDGWNDGNRQNPRTITVPDRSITYKASFALVAG